MSATVSPRDPAQQAAETVRRTLEEIKDIDPERAADLADDENVSHDGPRERSGDSPA